MSPKRWLALVCVAMLAIGSIASGQAPGDAPATLAALLAEVRGLRAEVNQVAGASIRTQLLVARLQLQEQRINGIAKQLADVQTQRAANDGGIAQMSARLKQIDEAIRNPSTAADARLHFEEELAAVKAPAAMMRQRSAELGAQESQLSGQLAAEQGRWVDFNERLDQIEREIREKR
jgi:chromosome segregation ATPase